MLPSIVYVSLTLLPIGLAQCYIYCGEDQLANEDAVGAICPLRLKLLPGVLVLDRWKFSHIEPLELLDAIAERLAKFVHLIIFIFLLLIFIMERLSCD